MHAHHVAEAAVRRGAAALLMGAIALLAPAGAANAEAPTSPQDAYGRCIKEQIEHSGVNPNLDVIQGYCCAQAGGKPSYTPNGKFLTCDLPADTSAGSGREPNPAKPGSVAVLRQLPEATHV